MGRLKKSVLIFGMNNLRECAMQDHITLYLLFFRLKSFVELPDQNVIEQKIKETTADNKYRNRGGNVQPVIFFRKLHTNANLYPIP